MPKGEKKAKAARTRTREKGRTRDSAQTKQGLLDAALTLFEKQGFSATGVNEIVETAGFTKGAFYHHFRSKDELLHLLHDRFLDELLEQADAVLAQSDSPEEQLRQLIKANVKNSDQYRAEITVFFNEYRRLAESSFVEIKRRRDAYQQVVADIIANGVAQGQFRPVPNAQVMAFGVIGMCTWTYRWFDRKGPMSLDEIAQMYAETVVVGLTNGSFATTS